MSNKLNPKFTKECCEALFAPPSESSATRAMMQMYNAQVRADHLKEVVPQYCDWVIRVLPYLKGMLAAHDAVEGVEGLNSQASELKKLIEMIDDAR